MSGSINANSTDANRKYWSAVKKLGLGNPLALGNAIKQVYEEERRNPREIQQRKGPPKTFAGTGGFQMTRRKKGNKK